MQLIGDKQLLANLNAVAPKVKNQCLTAGMRAASVVAKKQVKSDAKSAFPDRTGLLRKGIRSKAVKGRQGPAGKVYIDPKLTSSYQGRRVRPSKYAHLVEFGTKRLEKGHPTKAGAPAKRTHPETRAKPFLLDAYRKNQSAVMAALEQATRKKFDQMAAQFRTAVA